jgi:hypothetical protein
MNMQGDMSSLRASGRALKHLVPTVGSWSAPLSGLSPGSASEWTAGDPPFAHPCSGTGTQPSAGATAEPAHDQLYERLRRGCIG